MKEFLSSAVISLAGFNALAKLKNRLSRAQFFVFFLSLSYVLRRYKAVLQLFTKKFGETTYDRVGSVLLRSKAVRNEYSKLVNDTLVSGRQSAAEAWKEYGFTVTKIPEQGISADVLQRLVDNLAYLTHKKLEDTHHSGSIYSFNYWTNDALRYHPDLTLTGEEASVKHELATPADYDRLAQSLTELYTDAFRHSYLWNSLHEGEFGTGYWLQYQVIRMVADLYGGKPDECMGLVTSGGTESLMTAIRMYREWGIVNRNHEIGQGVILCSKSVHAAVNKGCKTFDVRIKQLPIDEFGRINVEEARKEAARIGTDLIAIIGSTPQYSLGTIDPIRELAGIAKEAGVGMHVDSCLGGFIINFLDNVNPNFLAIDGITSLSCDTHKNGWAPKGSSVLVTKAVPDVVHPPEVNLVFYGSYSIPDWDGGIYGTPSFAGSAACAHVLHAYLAMLHIGKSGYRQIANSVHDCVDKLAAIVESDPRLQLLGDHPVNVVAFRVNPQVNWEQGAIYAMVHEMAQRNIVMSAMTHGRVHFCVTGRSSADPEFVDYFAKVLKESTDITEVYAKEVREGKRKFPGDAGLYGSIEAAVEPTAENTKSKAEYYANLLLGKRVATDAVKAHFFALQDPYAKTQL